MLDFRRFIAPTVVAMIALLLAPVTTVLPALADDSTAAPAAGPAGYSLNTRLSGRPSGAALPGPANSANNMTHHGSGPVMHNPTLYNIFWLPSGHYTNAGTAAGDTAYENLMNRFWRDIGGSQFYTVVSQYPDGGGAPGSNVTFGPSNSVIDTTNAYPHAGTTGDPIGDADIRDEVNRMVIANPTWIKDINHEFFVYTAQGIQECNAGASECTFTFTGQPNAFCAYHNQYNAGGDTIYSFIGDNDLANGCGPGGGPNETQADAQVSVSSHEFIESVTDPHLNSWFGPAPANPEIGDKCNNTPAPQNAVGADVYLNGNPYVIQMEWSNAVATCAMSLCGSSFCPTTPTFQKTADATVTTGKEYSITIAVRNPSDSDADTVVTVKDTLPAGSTFVGGSANPAPSSINGQQVTWNLGTVAVHDQPTITFRATAGSGLQNGDNLHNCASLTWGDMLAAAQTPPADTCADTTAVNQPPVLNLPGDQFGAYHDPLSFTISASDVEASDTLIFGSSALPLGLALVNNGDRTATISGVLQSAPGVYPVTFTVNDGHNPDVTGSLNITIAAEESGLQYTGPTVIANGQPVMLSAVLLEDGTGGPPIVGATVNFTLGSGASAQFCSGVTLLNGTARCPILSVNQPLGAGIVSAEFAGNLLYLPSSASAATIQFSFLAEGAFVIGDLDASVGNNVNFWGSQWAKNNDLSGGSAPRAFKGFAARTGEPPATGATWTASGGNSSGPPAGPLPAYMGVVVASKASKSGREISGDTVHIVVVQVGPGYGPDPGSPGNGIVVAVYS